MLHYRALFKLGGMKRWGDMRHPDHEAFRRTRRQSNLATKCSVQRNGRGEFGSEHYIWHDSAPVTMIRVHRTVMSQRGYTPGVFLSTYNGIIARKRGRLRRTFRLSRPSTEATRSPIDAANATDVT